MTRSRLALLAIALGTLVLLFAAAGFALLRDDGSAPAAAGTSTAGPRGLDRCKNLLADDVNACYSREFERQIGGAKTAKEAQAALARISARAWATGPPLLSDCHGLMHAVGRHFVVSHQVTVATLMDYLPRSNDPGCTAGFAHGLVTGVAPQIDPRKPREAAAVCGRAGTRFQRYSCTHGFGHAFMRIYDDTLEPALELCRQLGRNSAPDCAQGAFHDYWFSVIGADDTTRPVGAITSPKELCAGQRAEFVRPCWYRAFVDTRPPGFQTGSPEDLEALCAGLAGVQRAGCITAASVIGPPDPSMQLQVCAGVAAPVDAISCIHGTKVQNIIDKPTSLYLRLIAFCDGFTGTPRPACYSWLGKTLSVITDGGFGRDGCPQVKAPASRKACLAGARSIDEPLETFS